MCIRDRVGPVHIGMTVGAGSAHDPVIAGDGRIGVDGTRMPGVDMALLAQERRP